MKKLLIVIALLTGAISYGKAQGQQGGGAQGNRMGGTPEERLQRSMAQLEPLKLTDDQKAKVTALYVAQSKTQDSLFKSAGQGGDRQAMMAEFQKMRAANDKKVMDILNDEQKKQYTAMMEARRNRQGGQGGGGQRPPQAGGNNQ